MVASAMRWLSGLAKACAVLGGLLLMAMTLVSCASVAGRNLLGATLVGDFEFSAAATGAAVALFLPLAQLRLSHIRVDFFTARASARTVQGLDRGGAALMAAIAGFMAWRTAIGASHAYASGASSMLLGLPEWLIHAAMVPGWALSSLIAGVQASWGLQGHKP